MKLKEALDQVKALRYWGLALCFLGGIGLGLTTNFLAAFSMLVLLWGNNMEQTARRYQEIIDREVAKGGKS